MPESICMMLTPVMVHPSMIARLIGAAPLKRGSSDAWTLTKPCFGRPSILSGIIFPYATTMTASRSSFFDGLENFRISFELLGLEHRDAMLQCKKLDRGHLELHGLFL